MRTWSQKETRGAWRAEQQEKGFFGLWLQLNSLTGAQKTEQWGDSRGCPMVCWKIQRKPLLLVGKLLNGGRKGEVIRPNIKREIQLIFVNGESFMLHSRPKVN